MLRKFTIKRTTTSYLVVPEDYDGILMYVYVADDTGKPLDEVLAEDNPYFVGPEIFGTQPDENVEDYVFIGINAPQ